MLQDEKVLALLKAPGLYSFDLIPNGIIFCSDMDGYRDLYFLSGRQIRPVFSERRNRIGPVGFRNSNSFLYFEDFEGDECFDIYLASIEGWDKNLTPSTSYSILPNATVSASGSLLAYVSDEEGSFASYVLDLRNGKKRRITDHEYSDVFASISPDGAYVAVESQWNGTNTRVSIFSARTGKRVMDIAEGNDILEASEPYWFSDSRRVCFSSSQHSHSEIGMISLNNGSIRWLTDGKEDCYSPVPSDAGDIAYLVCREGSVLLSTYSLVSGIRKFYGADGVAMSPAFSRDGSVIYYAFESPGSVRELHSLHRATRNARRLTDHRRKVPELDFVTGEHITVKNTRDGMLIPALLFTPKERAEAGVVYLHGGPTSAFLNYWEPLVQLLVASGIAVIAPNYRGSTCYGKEFRDANRFVMGDMDVSDCVAARNYLVENNLVPKDRVGVTGASFGGYLTMCCLTFYSELWKCGSAVVPFMNWFTEIENERSDLRYWDLTNMGDPVKDRERLMKASPYFYLENIRAPVQIIAGEHDPRCPRSESEEAVRKLRELGKQVDYICYEGEGHSFRSVERRADADYRCYKFLISHLLDGKQV